MAATQPTQQSHLKQPQRLPLPATQVFTETSHAMGRWAQRRWVWWQRRTGVGATNGSAHPDGGPAAPGPGTTELADADTAPVLFTLDGPVARVTLNRPARRNALNLACWTALGDVAAQLAVDHSVRVVVLTGAGSGTSGTFSAGSDITEFPHARLGT